MNLETEYNDILSAFCPGTDIGEKKCDVAMIKLVLTAIDTATTFLIVVNYVYFQEGISETVSKL